MVGAGGSFHEVRRSDLLDGLRPLSEGLVWRVFDLECIWKDVPAEGESLSRSVLSSRQLARLGDALEQVVWGYFFGAAEPGGLPAPEWDRLTQHRCAIVLVAFDSSFWSVWADLAQAPAALSTRFEVLRTLDARNTLP